MSTVKEPLGLLQLKTDIIICQKIDFVVVQILDTRIRNS